ncbi:hypothetical protein E4U53_002157 [Claviceps sorghi]|nr:hypothetical protein E4U53_002157 [Claviceps sorghi]
MERRAIDMPRLGYCHDHDLWVQFVDQPTAKMLVVQQRHVDFQGMALRASSDGAKPAMHDVVLDTTLRSSNQLSYGSFPKLLSTLLVV